MTEWSETQVEVSKEITKKEKELKAVRTRAGQYYGLEDHNLKFDCKEQQD